MTDWDSIAFDGRGNLVDLTARSDPGPPPDLTWSPFELISLTGESLFGSVVAVSDYRGLELNLVVVSEIFSDDGGSWVRVVPYGLFVRWSQAAADSRPTVPAPARAVLVRHLWVMHEKRVGSGSDGGSGPGGGSSRATGPLPAL